MHDLVASEVRYFSQGDEDNFFKWLSRIKIIKNLIYKHKDVIIELESQLIDDEDLEELIAIYLRYKLDLSQIAQFRHDGNQEWFANKKKLWYKKVFEFRGHNTFREFRGHNT